MPSELQRLLKIIDPSKTIDPIESGLADAVNSFSRKYNTISTRDEMVEFLAGLMRSAYSAGLGGASIPSTDDEFMYGLASNHLSVVYHYDEVYEIMKSGVDGGVYGIIKTLARLIAEYFARNEINSHVLEFWDDLSAQEKVDASMEYYELYEDILPGRVKQNWVRYRMKFWEVLEMHPAMIKQMRER